MTYSLETASWRCCPAPRESVFEGHPRRLLIIRSERCFGHVSESFRRISSRGMDENDDVFRFLNCAGVIVVVVLSTTKKACSVPPRVKCANAVKLDTTTMYSTDAASSVIAPGIHAPAMPLADSIVPWAKKQRAERYTIHAAEGSKKSTEVESSVPREPWSAEVAEVQQCSQKRQQSNV